MHCIFLSSHPEEVSSRVLPGFGGVSTDRERSAVDTSHRGHELHYGTKALISEQYRRDLADMTHRGMKGRATAHKVTGALPIGYISEDSPDGHGKVARIDTERASVVRRVFNSYAAGDSLAGIADDLNRAGIPTSGKKRTAWQASGIRAILKNGKYVGRWVWNTHKWIRDPDTRKRVYRKRPESEWISEERPQLAIIDPETWARVEARFTANGRLYKKRGAPVHYLLTGIVRCGECASPMHVCGGAKGYRYYQCAAAAKRGSTVCTNRRTLREGKLRTAILSQVNEVLLGVEAQRRLREIAVEEIQKLASSSDNDLEQVTKKLKDLDAKIENLIGTLASGLDSPAIRRTLESLENQRGDLVNELAHTKASKSIVVPSPELIAQRAQAIAQALDGDIPGAREALHGLFNEGRVDLHRTESGYDIVGAVALSALIPTHKNQNPLRQSEAGLDTDGCGDRI